MPVDSQIRMSPELVLVGSQDGLDSLTLITLIVEVEDKVKRKSGVYISILDLAVMSEDGPKFSTVSELAEWIYSKV